jgi:Ala-tRNA(Pro) deacylase
MPAKRLKEFLDNEQVKYVTIIHSPTYTAQEIAAAAHVHGRELAKTVMVTLDGAMAMVVLPASRKISFEQLREASGSENVQLATEHAFAAMFPGCEVGAMPPFGNLYGLDVYASKTLGKDEEIVFNAGTHTELIRMAYADFIRLVKPHLVRIACGED